MKLERFTYRSITIITRKVFIAIPLFFLILLCSSINAQQKATRQSALNAFNTGNFDVAYDQYTELSTQFPKDPLYKYYRGTCLVKLEKEPSLAAKLISESINESAAVRPVPTDAQFYLGRAQQMSGDFTEAVKSYESFTSQAGKKTAKEMGVPEYIKQSEAGKGNIKETAKVSAAVAPEKTAFAEKEILPDSYENMLSEALLLQGKADSLSQMATKYRGDLQNTEGTARTALWSKIQELEKLSLDYRTRADKKMTDAEKLAGLPDNQEKDTTDIAPEVKETTVAAIDSFSTFVPPVVAPVQKNDSLLVTPVKTGEKKQAEVTEIFADFNVTEKPVYKPDEKVTVNPAVPPGLIYRIQVAVFRNPVAPSYFKGLSPVHGFRNDANGITTYYAGMFRKSADAGKALPKVKSLGFKDAYVIALMDKKTVSNDRAAMLEKEWGSKPLYTVTSNQQAVRDTTPQTLVLRVEVKRSPKPLPKDQVEAMLKMAANRGFDVIVTDKKVNIYLIGTFLSYKSASEFADLLIRNGYRDAKVVAYLGTREIPIETARKFFDEL
jgi:hypothetical protein